MKEKVKAIVRENLSTKRIILFGAGDVAKAFYEEYKDELDISYCVSNYEREWGEGSFLGQLDVRKYCKEEICENDYIVVCGPIAFSHVEMQLRMDGFSMYEHFVESGIAQAVFQNKKIALFYGQCILRDMYGCIVKIPAFRDEYASVFTQAVVGQAVVTNRLLMYMKDLCDLYIYTPKILDRESIYFLAPEALPTTCKIISVSNLTVPIYWPQVVPKLDVYNKWYLHSYEAKRDTDFYHTLYRRADEHINKLVQEGKSAKQIVECLSKEDYFSEKQVKKNLAITMKTIEIAEKSVKVKIADYIGESYKSRMLYQNYIHPNKCIIWEYIRRLMKEIGVVCDGLEQLEEETPLHIHQGGDVPIYPSVIKHLGLEFVDETTKYEILTANGIEYMNFAEYIEHYVEYTKMSMDIMQMW